MSVDIARVAEQARLLVLRDPIRPEITGAYVVDGTGQRVGSVGSAELRATDLAVLDWDAGSSSAADQPLELVLGRVCHRYSPSTVAVAASPVGFYPARSALTAAAGAELGLLWTSDRTAAEIVDDVRRLADEPRRAAATSRALLEVLTGDAGLTPLTARLAGLLAARVVINDADMQVAADTGSVRAGSEVLGLELQHRGVVLGAMSVHRSWPLDAGEEEIVRAVAAVLGLGLHVHTADRSRADPAQAHLTRLLSEDVPAREAALRRSRRLQLFPPRRRVLVVIEPFALPDGHAGLVQLAQQLELPVRSADQQATMIVHEGGVTLLTDAGTDVDALVRAYRRGTSVPLSVGVSRVIGDIDSLLDAYTEAARAAMIGRRLGAADQVTSYEQLGLLRLLYQLPEADRRAYVSEVLGSIAGSDVEAVEHRRIIWALRATHANLAEAARELFVHRNTLRQRVARLESIIGPFLDNADRRLAVFVALDLHRLDDEAP